jgi:hypothetical protein
MSKNILYCLCAAAFVIAFWTIVLSLIPRHGTVVYDCRLAEISPDFPPDVRNECRKKNSGRI